MAVPTNRAPPLITARQNSFFCPGMGEHEVKRESSLLISWLCTMMRCDDGWWPTSFFLRSSAQELSLVQRRSLLDLPTRRHRRWRVTSFLFSFANLRFSSLVGSDVILWKNLIALIFFSALRLTSESFNRANRRRYTLNWAWSKIISCFSRASASELSQCLPEQETIMQRSSLSRWRILSPPLWREVKEAGGP